MNAQRLFVILLSGIVARGTVAAQNAGTPAQTRFTVGIEMPSEVPVTPAVESALRDMGVQYINYYVKPWAASPDNEAASANEAMLALADRLGIDFAISCYVVDPPDGCVRQALERGKRVTAS